MHCNKVNYILSWVQYDEGTLAFNVRKLLVVTQEILLLKIGVQIWFIVAFYSRHDQTYSKDATKNKYYAQYRISSMTCMSVQIIL